MSLPEWTFGEAEPDLVAQTALNTGRLAALAIRSRSFAINAERSRQAAKSCPAGRTYYTAARQAGPTILLPGRQDLPPAWPFDFGSFIEIKIRPVLLDPDLNIINRTKLPRRRFRCIPWQLPRRAAVRQSAEFLAHRGFG